MQDVNANRSKKFPGLYKAGIQNSYFNWKVLAVWFLSAIYQSLIFYYFPVAAGIIGQTSSGKMFGLWDIGTMAFTCVVVSVNLRLLMACTHLTKWHYISVVGSTLSWFIFIFIYGGVRTTYDKQVCFVVSRG